MESFSPHSGESFEPLRAVTYAKIIALPDLSGPPVEFECSQPIFDSTNWNPGSRPACKLDSEVKFGLLSGQGESRGFDGLMTEIKMMLDQDPCHIKSLQVQRPLMRTVQIKKSH